MKNVLITVIVVLMITQIFAADKASDFKLENLKGKQVKLSEFQEEGLVILDFWATWCVPCKNGLPKINEIHEKYDNVNVLGINVDKPRKKSKAVAHVKSNRFSFHTLFDPKKNVQKQFNVTNIPRTLIIDQESNIIYDHTGYQRGDEKHYEEVIIKWIEQQNAEAEPKAVEPETVNE